MARFGDTTEVNVFIKPNDPALLPGLNVEKSTPELLQPRTKAGGNDLVVCLRLLNERPAPHKFYKNMHSFTAEVVVGVVNVSARC